MTDLKTAEIHWDAKHDKQGPFSADTFVNVHAEVQSLAQQARKAFCLTDIGVPW